MTTRLDAATAERDRVLDEVVAKMSSRGTLSPGMRVVEKWARGGREFSLNDIRVELAAAGVDGQFAPGGLIQRALKAGLIVKVRKVISTSGPTHAKEINAYRGAHTSVAHGEAVTVPVQRNRVGRFTAGPDDAMTPALFDVAVGS